MSELKIVKKSPSKKHGNNKNLELFAVIDKMVAGDSVEVFKSDAIVRSVAFRWKHKNDALTAKFVTEKTNKGCILYRTK